MNQSLSSNLLVPYPPLEEALFLKRYQRFLVDVERVNGDIETVHCANSGSMKSCLVPKARAYILDSQNPLRKLKYTLELLELEDGLACVNTGQANRVVQKILEQRSAKDPAYSGIQEHFSQWSQLTPEAKYSAETRFDFCLWNQGQNKKCWIEVKSVSLRLDDGSWAFPDAKTTRGQRHLRHLQEAKEEGDEAWLWFVLMRGSLKPAQELISHFRIAKEIDPLYNALYEQARAAGVKIAIVVPSIHRMGFALRDFAVLHKDVH